MSAHRSTVAAIGVLALFASLSARAAPANVPARPIAGYEIVVLETSVDTAVLKQLIVSCPQGKKALGAGWSALDVTGAILEGSATYSEPLWDGSGWMVNARLSSGYTSDWKLRLRLVCASAA